MTYLAVDLGDFIGILCFRMLIHNQQTRVASLSREDILEGYKRREASQHISIFSALAQARAYQFVHGIVFSAQHTSQIRWVSRVALLHPVPTPP